MRENHYWPSDQGAHIQAQHVKEHIQGFCRESDTKERSQESIY